MLIKANLFKEGLGNPEKFVGFELKLVGGGGPWLKDCRGSNGWKTGGGPPRLKVGLGRLKEGGRGKVGQPKLYCFESAGLGS